MKAELQAQHDREVSKFAEVIRAELETFMAEIIGHLKKVKAIGASARPFEKHADISEGDEDSNEELPNDVDLDSTDGDKCFNSEKEIHSGEETPYEFLPPISKSKKRLGEVA